MTDEPAKKADHLKVVPDQEESQPIPKPKEGEVDLSRFKSKKSAALAGVATLLTALPHGRVPDQEDYVRLHPEEKKYWSDEMCFVNVPIHGQKSDTLHLIDEDLAMRFLAPKRIQRFRLALATKPHDVFFLAHVPTRNLDNIWNQTNQQGCELAKTAWTQLTSRGPEGAEGYKIDHAEDGDDAFPVPKWPTQTLDELIAATFAGRMIMVEDHPGLLRLRGAKQVIE
jgi:hypothetical protein